MTPAYATLFNPSAASGLAVARLRETATLLAAEGMRGKDLTLDEWVTIVDIDRVLPETPPPGRMAPLLRAAGRVAARAAQIVGRGLAGNPMTTGEKQSLDTAAAFALSACRLVRARAKIAIEPPEIDISAWLSMLQTSRKALSDAMRSALDPNDLDTIEQASDDMQAIAIYLNDPPPPGFASLFSTIDAMRWSRWLYQTHADIYLLRKELVSMAGWNNDSSVAVIRLDSDGMAVVDATVNDPLRFASSWDVESMAERLAAGVEVSL